MAEGYFNRFATSGQSTSAALIEDRRNKYDGRPSFEVMEIMRNDCVDLGNQTVKLLNKRMCEEAGRIFLFLNPEGKISEFTIEGRDAVEFLMKAYGNKVTIVPIKDPY